MRTTVVVVAVLLAMPVLAVLAWGIVAGLQIALFAKALESAADALPTLLPSILPTVAPTATATPTPTP